MTDKPPRERSWASDLTDFFLLVTATLGFVFLVAFFFAITSCGPFTATVSAAGTPCAEEDASTVVPRSCPSCAEAGTTP